MNPLQEYISIIHNRQQNPIVKGERHHIIPKSCGGCNKKWNLVRLTSEEHIECHRLLTLIYPTGDEHRAMCAAYALMCTSRGGVKVSDEQAAEARRLSSESMVGFKHSPETRKKLSEIAKRRPPMSQETRKILSEKGKGRHPSIYGKHHTLETRQKMSATRKGMPQPWKRVPRTDETKQKLSKALKGRKLGPMTEEHKKHLSESLKGRSSPNKGKHYNLPPWTEERRKRFMATIAARKVKG